QISWLSVQSVRYGSSQTPLGSVPAPELVGDYDRAGGLVPEPLARIADDEDPVERTQNLERIAHKRLAKGAGGPGCRVDHLCAEPPLAETLTTLKSIGKQVVEQPPSASDQEQWSTDKRKAVGAQEKRGGQRGATHGRVDHLAEEAVRARGKRHLARGQ